MCRKFERPTLEAIARIVELLVGETEANVSRGSGENSRARDDLVVDSQLSLF